MSENPFAAPVTSTEVPPAQLPWFPAGRRKVYVMTFLTFGIYGVYWFERQFRFQKRAHGLDTWPLARAIFAIFFVTTLFEDVERAATMKEVSHPWSARAMAALYIVCAIADRVIDRVTRDVEDMGVNIIIMFVSLALVLGLAHPLASVQETINEILAKTGQTFEPNERFTVWNYLVGTLFALLVLAFAASLFVPV